MLATAAAVLDVGAGDGYLASKILEWLPTGGRVVCFDPHYTDEDLSRFAATAGRGLTFSRERPTGRFDVLLLLDVLEHVPDDQDLADRLVAESVNAEGWVVVSVPAWPRIFAQHDVALGHFRRYTPAACGRILRKANLTVMKSGGLFHVPLALRVVTFTREAIARRLRFRVAPPANLGEWSHGPLFSAVVNGLLLADTFFSRKIALHGLSLPGLSFWALCRRGAGG